MVHLPKLPAAIALGLAAMIMLMGMSNAQTPNSIIQPLPLKKYHPHPQPLSQGLQQRRPSLAYQASAGGTWSYLNNYVNYFLGAPQVLTDGSVFFRAPCSTGINFKLTPDINGSYVNGTWTQIASLPVISGTQYSPLWYASQVLPDGRFIINGGETGTYLPDCTSTNTWTTMGAIYDPVADTWTAVSPPSGWSKIGDAPSVVLANGTYLLGSCR
jgi:hypothetical protein